MSDRETRGNRIFRLSRRKAWKGPAAGLGALALPRKDASAAFWESFFQKHFRELGRAEIRDVVSRLEKEYGATYGKPVKVKTTPPMEGVLYGYGLDLSRRLGGRGGVHGCVGENNQSRDPQGRWIRGLR